MQFSRLQLGDDMAAVLGHAVAGRPAPAPLLTPELADALLKVGAGPLAWWAFKASLDRHHPSLRRLEDAAVHESFRLTVAAQDLERLLAAFSAASITARVAKGHSLARSYWQPELRPFSDLDVYVTTDTFAAARAIVHQLTPTLRRSVDLHRGLSYLDDLPQATVLARASSYPLGASQVPTFSRTDELRLVCLHALAEGVLRPTWLCDIAMLARDERATIDWDQFAESRGWRSRWATFGLALARDVLSIELPDAAEQLTHDAGFRQTPAWARRTVIDAWSAQRLIKGGRRAFRWRAPGLPGLANALTERWPTPLEAVSSRGAGVPRRWPLGAQLAECVRRSWVYVRRASA